MSTTRVSEVAAMFSPLLRSPVPPSAPFSPTPSDSPYRLPPIPKSSSAHDMVSGIVDKFNSLSVTDREEEKARYERQIGKLKAALERAVVAREEAEEEAGRLREKMGAMKEEWGQERDCLRERCAEYEKKYEKAKDRFKLQRAKNEEAMQRVRDEHLEKEKEHWRELAKVEELEEWERRLRSEAHSLVDFVELERSFEGQSPSRPLRISTAIPEPRSVSALSVAVEEITIVPEQPERRQEERRWEQRPVLEEIVIEERSLNFQAVLEPSREDTERTITAQESSESLREVTPEGPPSMPIRPFATPAKQVIRVPVDFGDDKENQEPTVAEVLKTPMTMDRAAALAAIEYRRGRARSFMNAQMTPKTLALADKRDVSAPAMVTMSVGRKR